MDFKIVVLTIFIFNLFNFVSILATPHGMQELSSLSRDWTRALYSGGTEY